MGICKKLTVGARNFVEFFCTGNCISNGSPGRPAYDPNKQPGQNEAKRNQERLKGVNNYPKNGVYEVKQYRLRHMLVQEWRLA